MIQIENQKKFAQPEVGKYDCISGGENCTIIILPSYYGHLSTVPIIFGPSGQPYIRSHFNVFTMTTTSPQWQWSLKFVPTAKQPLNNSQLINY